jgi:hypothetical protein
MSYIRKTVDIQVSDELKIILEQIKSGSEVAKLLLKSRHNREDLQENHVNYISTSKTNAGMISYLTPERLEVVGDEIWTSTKRFIAKPGAFLKKLFKEVTEKDIEIFTNLYRNVQNVSKMDFEIIEGERIRYFYNENNYSTRSSSLGSSCMRYNSCQEFFDLYCSNSDSIKMLILKEGNNLIGRAILWEDIKVMDRIYTYNDEKFIFQFKKWADEKGYSYKSEQKWNNTLSFQNSSEKSLQEYCIKLKNWDFEKYPYMDTFKFLDSDTGYLYNYKPKDGNIRILNSANGDSYDRDFLQLDEFSKLYHYEDDVRYIDYRDIWTVRHNTNYSDFLEKYILASDSKWEERLGTFIFADNSLNDWGKIRKNIEDQISSFPTIEKCGKWERERLAQLQEYLKSLTATEELV